MKDENSVETPVFKRELTVAETDLIANYFRPSSDDDWRLSLIAFPHSQTFPSRVHSVMHSHRTGILIDMMQHLEGLTFIKERGASLFEVCSIRRNTNFCFYAIFNCLCFHDWLQDDMSSARCSGAQTIEPFEKNKEGSFSFMFWIWHVL